MQKYLKHFPEPLLQDLVAGRWLPIVGAGLSLNARVPRGGAMPLWNDLGAQLAKDIPDHSYMGALDAISSFEHEYGRPKLVERLAMALHTNDAAPGDAHRAFCEIPFEMVCTTNFDFLLEQQYGLGPTSCTPLVDEDQLAINLRGSGVCLLKLHGDLHHPARLIATEEDYDGFLSKYPLIATFLANLLITRTAVLVGYSLDDPDFRQVWQVVGDRLGKSRRLAYAIMVGARQQDVARFERRGVRVVNLPGSKSNYSSILTSAFAELKEYTRDNILSVSHVTDENSLRELSLPRGSAKRLCFFALPLNLHSFYRERVFPIAQAAGLVPVTADDVIAPGDGFAGKIDAIIEHSPIVVVDASTSFTVAEARMAERGKRSKVLIISADAARLPRDLSDNSVVNRPDLVSGDVGDFLRRLEDWFLGATEDLAPTLEEEPTRLLKAREYRAAVVAAITLLEARLRRGRVNSKSESPRSIPLRTMLIDALTSELISNQQHQQILTWTKLRNEVVHNDIRVTRGTSTQIVEGVLDLLRSLDNA